MKIWLYATTTIIMISSLMMTNTWAETPTEKAILEATERGERVSKEVKADLEKELELSRTGFAGEAVLLIYSDTKWGGDIRDTSNTKREFVGDGNQRIAFTCIPGNYYVISFQTKDEGYMAMFVIYRGEMIDATITRSKFYNEGLQGKCGIGKIEPYLSKESVLELIQSFIIQRATPPVTAEWIEQDVEDQLLVESNRIPNKALLLIYSDTYWSGGVVDSSFDSATIDGYKMEKIPFTCSNGGTYSLSFQKNENKETLPFPGFLEDPFYSGILAAAVIQDGKLLDAKSTTAEYGVVNLAGACKPAPQKETKLESQSPQGGGCLVATAAFGSELAPQVQMLRETRDNIVMKTQSGAAFMIAFNSVYYSFAPTVADWERQNPVFKETMKITITPLITTLSILNYVDIDSEAEFKKAQDWTKRYNLVWWELD